MKVIKKQIVSTIEQYEAIDGKIFDNKKDCEEWDKSYWCTIVNSFEKLKSEQIDAYEFGCGNEDDNCFLMVLSNLDDVVVFNAYVSHRCYYEPIVDARHIGKTLLVNFGYDYDWCSVNILEDWIANKQKVWADSLEKLNKTEEVG